MKIALDRRIFREAITGWAVLVIPILIVLKILSGNGGPDYLNDPASIAFILFASAFLILLIAAFFGGIKISMRRNGDG